MCVLFIDCRLYLAAMHYNENDDREQATTSSGQAVYKVIFLKSKKVECTAKPVKTEPLSPVRCKITFIYE